MVSAGQLNDAQLVGKRLAIGRHPDADVGIGKPRPHATLLVLKEHRHRFADKLLVVDAPFQLAELPQPAAARK